jgi:hypothetical protein
MDSMGRSSVVRVVSLSALSMAGSYLQSVSDLFHDAVMAESAILVPTAAMVNTPIVYADATMTGPLMVGVPAIAVVLAFNTAPGRPRLVCLPA